MTASADRRSLWARRAFGSCFHAANKNGVDRQAFVPNPRVTFDGQPNPRAFKAPDAASRSKAIAGTGPGSYTAKRGA